MKNEQEIKALRKERNQWKNAFDNECKRPFPSMSNLDHYRRKMAIIDAELFEYFSQKEDLDWPEEMQ